MLTREPRPRRAVSALQRVTVLALGMLAFPAIALAAPAPGDLDPSFGHHGKVLTGFKKSANAVAIGGQGRIVAAGSSPFAVMRYRPNGRLDDSFSGDGKVKTKFGGKATAANAVAIGDHGKVVAAGGTTRHLKSRIAVAQYKSNGHLDDSFSHNGKVTLGLGPGTRTETAHGVAIGSNGRIVVAGEAPKEDHGPSRVVLARFKDNGRLDRSFSENGIVKGGRGAGLSLAIDSANRITISAGDHLLRYNANGRLDRSFGTDGTASLSFIASSVALDTSGRIAAAGTRFGADAYDSEFALARFKGNGRPDPSFGTGGEVATGFSQGGGAVSVAIDSRKRVVAFGYAYKAGKCCQFAVVRYKPNGDRDRSFGNGGKVRTGFRGRPVNVQPGGVATDRQDRIVAAGGARQGFALVRYIG
jgi:uncharacterized delta-60 repeat protein